MDSAKVNDWMQVAGIFAVVVSLVFVGLQLRQSQEIAVASQYQARAESSMDFYRTGIESDTVIRGLRSRVSDEVSAGDISYALWGWTSFDNLHFQYQSGFLTEEAWQHQVWNYRRLYSQCPVRFVYDLNREGHRPSFVSFIDTFEDPCK